MAIKVGWASLFCKTMTLVILSGTVGGPSTYAQWPQWGGPNRNFMVEATGLADSWPDEGPPRLWQRELGEGYSAITVDDGVLYTMYGAKGAECTVALDPKTGRTLWEHKNTAPYVGTEYGPGPHSTPLVVGDRLFTVGAMAVVHCFDKKTGKVLWSYDLPTKFAAPIPYYGYSPSPIAYQDTIILPVDRKRAGTYLARSQKVPQSAADETPAVQSLMAFDQATGRVVWKNQDFPVDYSSPLLINFEGEDQLVLFMRKEIIGVDPNDGALRWRIDCLPTPDENIATPVWNGKDLLFFSAAYNSGSRVIQLTKQSGKTVPKQLWYHRKLRIHHGNAIQLGDHIYGSSGDFGMALLVCLHLKTGKIAWRERGFKKATFVYADGKLIILDEDGWLALATATPEGLTVHSKCKVTEHLSWTAPTLVGQTLYVRDRKNILALDLG